MTEELALQAVRKAKAKKTHLTVPAGADADVRTLCGVAMAGGEYDLIDGHADCQPCLRKKDNRAFISSAYFAQDAGTRLLEMSLQRTRKGRTGAARTAPRGRRPDLRVVEAEAQPSGAEPAATPASRPEKVATRRSSPDPNPLRDEPGAADALSEDELRALGLEQLERVGPMVYRSPAGVLVRIQRQGHGWRIAELTFDGPASLSARASGRTTTVMGDVRLEASETGLRLKPTSHRG